MLLRQCLDDVKLEIAKKQAEFESKRLHLPALGNNRSADAVSLHEITAQDRVLELLLSQQRVVQLLYDKSFPDRPASPTAQKANEEDGFGMSPGGYDGPEPDMPGAGYDDGAVGM